MMSTAGQWISPVPDTSSAYLYTKTLLQILCFQGTAGYLNWKSDKHFLCFVSNFSHTAHIKFSSVWQTTVLNSFILCIITMTDHHVNRPTEYLNERNIMKQPVKRKLSTLPSAETIPRSRACEKDVRQKNLPTEIMNLNNPMMHELRAKSYRVEKSRTHKTHDIQKISRFTNVFPIAVSTSAIRARSNYMCTNQTLRAVSRWVVTWKDHQLSTACKPPRRAVTTGQSDFRPDQQVVNQITWNTQRAIDNTGTGNTLQTLGLAAQNWMCIINQVEKCTNFDRNSNIHLS